MILHSTVNPSIQALKYTSNLPSGAPSLLLSSYLIVSILLLRQASILPLSSFLASSLSLSIFISVYWYYFFLSLPSLLPFPHIPYVPLFLFFLFLSCFSIFFCSQYYQGIASILTVGLHSLALLVF